MVVRCCSIIVSMNSLPCMCLPGRSPIHAACAALEMHTAAVLWAMNADVNVQVLVSPMRRSVGPPACIARVVLICMHLTVLVTPGFYQRQRAYSLVCMV